jgi:hypothetical protein
MDQQYRFFCKEQNRRPVWRPSQTGCEPTTCLSDVRRFITAMTVKDVMALGQKIQAGTLRKSHRLAGSISKL